MGLQTLSQVLKEYPCFYCARVAFGNYFMFAPTSSAAQSIRFNFDTQQYGVAAAPLVISDAPKFAWRGILIDTDRHWLSLHHIFRIIDAMGYAKLNIMHWCDSYFRSPMTHTALAPPPSSLLAGTSSTGKRGLSRAPRTLRCGPLLGAPVNATPWLT
jgi:hypothetical protein